MQLVNQTPVPAMLQRATSLDRESRRAIVTAKATFGIEGEELRLDRTDPVSIFHEPSGEGALWLPSDEAPRRFDHFEVMLVGHVRADAPITERVLTMRVGEVERSLVVFGDRSWERDHDGQWRASEPSPFVEMPLCWSRAFGGASHIEVDEGAFVPFSYAFNPRGRGYWAGDDARALSRAIGAPEAFPRLAPPGPLPNLESPRARIATPKDFTPVPACWAPMPLEVAARMGRAIERLPPDPSAEDLAELRRFIARRTFTSAHPDWVLERAPEPGTRVVVDGLGRPMAFSIPRLRVQADVLYRGQIRRYELMPQCLLILADQRRVTQTYRLALRYRYDEGDERAVRLSLEDVHGS